MPRFRGSALVPILLIIAGANGARAQLPNVRAKLNQPEKNGLYGEVEGGAEWKTGNTDTVVLNGLIWSQYRHDRNHIMFFWNARYLAASGKAFETEVTQHLRYSYDITRWIASELFVQYKYDAFQRLRYRAIFGVGPSFTAVSQKIFTLKFGSAYLFEYEKLDFGLDQAGNPLPDASRREINHRWSNSVSWGLIFGERIKVGNAVLVQPRFDDFADVRVLSELAVIVQIIDRLALRISFSLSYDRCPPKDVDPLDMYLSTRLVVTFGPI